MPPTEPNASNPQSSAFPIRIALTTAAIAVLALIAVWLALAPKGANPSLVGGPFALEDGAGKTVTERTLRGRPFLVYFGYTHCPDVCPTELAHISDVLAAMGDKAVPALFITVDPERDTPKVMQDYASSFGPHVDRAVRQPAGDRRGRKGIPRVRPQGEGRVRRQLLDGPQLGRLPDGQERGIRRGAQRRQAAGRGGEGAGALPLSGSGPV